MFLNKFLVKWKSKKLFDKISDFVFIILLLALLVPQSRTALIVGVKRLTAFSPGIIKNDERQQLQEMDYYWELDSLSGESLNLVDFAGKTLFINQWATWCPPCIAEMPSIDKLFLQLKNDADVVFIIVTNEKIPVVREFMNEHDYSFSVFFARSKTPDALYSPSIPTTFVISPDGEIVLKEVGAKKWHGEETVKFIQSLKGLEEDGR
jgi:thiol-disulfide isomerase/thioredoxin